MIWILVFFASFAAIVRRVESGGFDLFNRPSEPDMENPRHYKYLEKYVNIFNLDDFDVVFFEMKWVACLFLPDYVNYKEEEEVYSKLAEKMHNETGIVFGIVDHFSLSIMEQ